MGNYDHSVQRNLDKKMSQYGMVPDTPRPSSPLSEIADPTCDVTKSEACVRSMEYLQRIVKSLLRQMRVHSHVFGPGEAITIDLQAEIKYDDYVILNKFMNAKHESDKFLPRIDGIMSNLLHVVEHAPSRFEFLDAIVNFPAFYSLKFWVILLTSMVVGSMIVMLLVKAFYTSSVPIQFTYGFLIIFIVSCVWSFSNLYEDKRAELMAHMVQNSGAPPKDCEYHSLGVLESVIYFIRVNVMNKKDQCAEYYSETMTDPLWKVNPMQAISTSAAFFFFEPLGYIGTKLGAFYQGFIEDAPWLLKPVLLAVSLFLTVLFVIGPFRISTPLLTIEPAWRPNFPALERLPVQIVRAIGHENVRNEIMERPEGPIVKSVRNASTDMDGFQEYLTDEGSDELEVIGPFARFSLDDDTKAREASASVLTPVSVNQDSSHDTKIFTLSPPLKREVVKESELYLRQANDPSSAAIKKEPKEEPEEDDVHTMHQFSMQ